MRRALHRMNSMVNDLSEVTTLEAGAIALQRSPVALNAFLPELLHRNRGVIEIDRVTLELAPDLPPVFADADRLERILLNLLTNAQKYSPGGTPIRVRVTPHEGEVVVHVIDCGQGIPAADLPYIFDCFYRSRYKRCAEGLGLGLYFTRMLVEAHGGHLDVDSAIDRGSTFRFTLPVAD